MEMVEVVAEHNRPGHGDVNQQILGELVLAEECVPVVVVQVCGDDRRFSRVSLVHELEEDVGLFGTEVQVSHFIDDDEVETDEAVE